MSKIIYVLTKGIGGRKAPGGGPKIIFEHLNRLKKRGYKVALFHLGQFEQPDWFELEVPVIRFADYSDLVEALKFEDTIKVATWWETAYLVYQGAKKGEGFYLVQDIETCYASSYQEAELIFKSYELGLHIFTDSPWAKKQLTKIYGRDVPYVPVAINHSVFYPRKTSKNHLRILYLDRSHYLKGREVFSEALVYALKRKPELALMTFGHEPPGYYADIAHSHADFPKDGRKIAELYSSAACFVLSSHHEGFGIPLLEAMACGCPVVTTRADGNEDLCTDNFNCLMVSKGDSQAMGEAIVKILEDEGLRRKLIDNGLKTASKFTWDKSIDRLEKVLGLTT